MRSRMTWPAAADKVTWFKGSQSLPSGIRGKRACSAWCGSLRARLIFQMMSGSSEWSVVTGWSTLPLSTAGALSWTRMGVQGIDLANAPFLGFWYGLRTRMYGESETKRKRCPENKRCFCMGHRAEEAPRRCRNLPRCSHKHSFDSTPSNRKITG